MSQSPVAAATYALFLFWAVGIAIALAFSDTEGGLIRDHPLFGRRFTGVSVPPMALTGMVLAFLIRPGALPPTWILGSIPLMLPFAGFSLRWSRLWVGHHPAWERRRAGIATVAAGLLGVALSSLLALYYMTPVWRGVIPITVFAAGVLLPGALLSLSVMAVTAGLPEEVPAGPVQGVAEIAGAGLLATALVLVDVGAAFLQAGAGWPAQARFLLLGWSAGTLAIPGTILLVRLWWRSMPDKLFMPLALTAALLGQWMAYLFLFGFPGLVPPIHWD